MDKTVEDYLKEFQERHKKEMDEAKAAFKSKLSDYIQKDGACRLEIGYSGSGDDGNIDSATLYDENGNEIDFDKELEQLIDQYAYELLNLFHDGWEINDGSQGTIIIDDLVELKGKIEHTEFYTESQESTTDF